MKKIKKCLLPFFTFTFLLSGVGGALTYNVTADAATNKTGFYVEDGAAVRLKSEYEQFGIKFSAQVGEVVEGATYHILIAPVELVNIYEADTNADKGDIVTYLTAYAESKGGRLSIVENCEVKDGKIEGAIVNVLWENINRKFVGVAYYEKDGKITVANYADDGERSIVDVSQNALDSGDYTKTSDLKALFEKVRYGEMLANGATKTERESRAYQYEQFYGASVNNATVTTVAGTSIALNGATGSIKDNALQISGGNGGNVTVDFGEIPAGTYRVQMGQTLVDGEFTSQITQNGNKSLVRVWDTKALGDGLYEFYFSQEKAGNASFTLSTETTGTVMLDNIALEPVAVSELEYSREKYMFGIGGLAAGINASSEGGYCDSRASSEWMAVAVNTLGVESQRVWLSIPEIINRAENSNQLSINEAVANAYHEHFTRLKAAGIQRITVMLSRFIYPYDYEHCSSNCVPDPNKESAVYKTWLQMQYEAFTLLAKEFPEITLWEAGNEYDLDTFLYKNGLKNKESWELARNYTFTNEVKAYITADISYAASKAFKLYNPENQIVLPGMSKYAADKSNDHITLSSANKKYYFEELYKHIESGKLPTLETVKVTDPDEYFDIIAYHAYADNVQQFENYNDTLLATAAAHGDGDKRVWITELGFTENAFGGKGTAEAQNAIATLTGKILTSLEQEKYAGLIETVHFFRLSDAPNLGDSGESCYGIYNAPSATTNANKAKPIAVTLYNYFNNANVSVEDLTFWEGNFRQQDFENATWDGTDLLHAGADINFFHTTGELVDYNGGKALQVTKTVKDYAYVMFAVGAIEKGTYELTLDAITNNGYNAIVQFRSQSNVLIQESINNYKTLFDLAKKDGNTYVLRISVQEDYDDFGIILAASNPTTVGETILIDNVSFKKTNVIQTMDFEDGVVQKIAGNGDTEAKVFAGYASTYISTDGDGVINLPNELVTENGNTYFTVNYKGWSSWSAFNLGFFQAGTYTVTMDVKLISGTMNGTFIKRVNNKNVVLTEGVDYTVDGEKYTFTITLEEDCMNFGIGYQCHAGQNANFTVGYDNVEVVIGTNVDGGADDGYDWIDSIINKEKN